MVETKKKHRPKKTHGGKTETHSRKAKRRTHHHSRKRGGGKPGDDVKQGTEQVNQDTEQKKVIQSTSPTAVQTAALNAVTSAIGKAVEKTVDSAEQPQPNVNDQANAEQQERRDSTEGESQRKETTAKTKPVQEQEKKEEPKADTNPVQKKENKEATADANSAEEQENKVEQESDAISAEKGETKVEPKADTEPAQEQEQPNEVEPKADTEPAQEQEQPNEVEQESDANSAQEQEQQNEVEQKSDAIPVKGVQPTNKDTAETILLSILKAVQEQLERVKNRKEESDDTKNNPSIVATPNPKESKNPDGQDGSQTGGKAGTKVTDEWRWNPATRRFWDDKQKALLLVHSSSDAMRQTAISLWDTLPSMTHPSSSIYWLEESSSASADPSSSSSQSKVAVQRYSFKDFGRYYQRKFMQDGHISNQQKYERLVHKYFDQACLVIVGADRFAFTQGGHSTSSHGHALLQLAQLAQGLRVCFLTASTTFSTIPDFFGLVNTVQLVNHASPVHAADVMKSPGSKEIAKPELVRQKLATTICFVQSNGTETDQCIRIGNSKVCDFSQHGGGGQGDGATADSSHSLVSEIEHILRIDPTEHSIEGIHRLLEARPIHSGGGDNDRDPVVTTEATGFRRRVVPTEAVYAAVQELSQRTQGKVVLHGGTQVIVSALKEWPSTGAVGGGEVDDDDVGSDDAGEGEGGGEEE